MPAEWEKHDAVWLSWPYDPTTFPDRVEGVEKTYVRIIEVLTGSEQVNLLVKDEGMESRVRALLGKEDICHKDVVFHIYDYVDVWFRDYGPVFIVNEDKKELAMVDWIFNAWGEKYKTHIRDTRIPDFINKNINIPCFKPGIVLEGGSIDVNGNGTLITTEECLLNKNRNTDLSKKDIEGYLKDYLGTRKVIWLKRGIAGDDTDGHVDDIARFVSPRTVICVCEEDKNDENYIALHENYEILFNSRDQDENRLNVIKLPMPGFISNETGRLPRSYANFYIGNTVVLVPFFGVENDSKALSIIDALFPDRKAIGIDCIDLIYGFGAIHCITQQQPKSLTRTSFSILHKPPVLC
jgi:agmatine deiminase